jgi:hypothetical protein
MLRLARLCSIAAAALIWSPFDAQAKPVAALAPAQARATIVRPLSLVKTSDMDFGNLAVGSGGTATINPSTGALTFTGGLQSIGGTPRQASFLGESTGLALVWIHFPKASAALKRMGGTETLMLSDFTLDGAAIRLVGGGPLTFQVGGRLTVPGNTVAGTYVGSFDVTMDYY